MSETLESTGYHGVEAIEYITGKQEERKTHYLIRMGAVTAVSREQGPAGRARSSRRTSIGGAKVQSFEWSEGGDKVYLRLDKAVETWPWWSTTLKAGRAQARPRCSRSAAPRTTATRPRW